ncbi:MAG: 23S rRNA (uracil(1939)-C(5))-methyltransferase RlmD [Calditrichaeota bacterium]|nr:MAG: 23S rRNA (uracil(1939)-C(5))-methyltransferase RlmD [Calditrichota bacterium]MBL1206771.1 23S rRNA (uracil(1939)-C(5))-methyltransferase RlmD [Calditrichota bacterium]NOG46597.1 23S rRNA (uracil(1939)-C(5))-methyltransferase RlmD [Calditrichota bacterium]
MNNQYPVKKNQVYPLDVTSLAFGGQGVARIDDYVVFIKRALPGDNVNARITKRKKSYAEARIVSFNKKSDQRIDPQCKFFDSCGGCTWQNLIYKDQLAYKTQIVSDSVSRISGLKETTVKPIIPSESFFHYRNKMEFSFAEKKWLTFEELENKSISKDFALGLHVPGTFDKIVHIDKCLLQSNEASGILDFVSKYSQENNLTPYGIRSHEGLLRFLVIRQSHYNKEIMVNIVTAYKDKKIQELADELLDRFENIAGIVNNINSRKAQIAVGEEEILLAGKDWIEDKIGPFVFRISANSFFQTNTAQAELLYETAINFADINPDETVWDLYSGTGTISLFLAQKAKNVIGFEITQSSVENAFENAEKYNVKNVDFVAGDVINNMETSQEKVDVIVTDPPRAGMHEKVVLSILKIAPKKIVYVSCNPTTMARDLKLLEEKYTVDIIQPVDMFPQTYHIECVTRLSLKNNK